MKIERKPGFDPVFHEKVRECIMAAHEIVIRASLDTPEMREYLNGVRVIPSRQMTASAGRASFRKKRIALNARLLTLNPDQILSVLVHEMAHLIHAKLGNGFSNHGPEWKQLMVRLGFPPQRCHDMDTKALRRLSI